MVRVIRFWQILVMLAAFTPGVMRGQESSAPETGVAQAYLYLEPFQARVEVLIDVPAASRWLEKPVEAGKPVSVADQKFLQDGMMKLARNWCRVRADEREAPGDITGAAMVKGKPGQTLPMTEGEEPLGKELMVGVMFEYAMAGSPAQIELRWNDFPPSLQKIPLTIFFGNSTESQEITATYPVARWANKGRLPRPKPLAEVPKLPVAQVFAIPLAMGLWIVFGLVIYIWMTWREKKFPGGFAPFLAAWLVGIGVTYNMTVKIKDPFAGSAAPVETPEQADSVLQPLLKNVYRAFDYRVESDIYDRLARSVDGELLRTLYLQTIQALTLDGREGARVRVTDLSVAVDKVKRTDDGFEAEGEWTALGTVGHWGHQHQRVNRYKAKIGVRPVQNEWKIVSMEVLEERRL